MAIGRTFQESFQKALRGLEVGVDGMNQRTTDRGEELEKELGEPGPERVWCSRRCLRKWLHARRSASVTRIDPWFLAQIEDIVKVEMQTR